MPAEQPIPETPKKRSFDGFLFALLCGLFTLVFCAAFDVHVYVTSVLCDGTQQLVLSQTDDPQKIVAKTTFALGRFDEVNLDDFDPQRPDSRIAIERHSEALPGAALLRLMQSDTLARAVVDMQTRTKKEQKTKPFSVRIVCDGKKQTLKLRGGTVQEALKTAGVTLGGDDLVSRPLTAKLKKNTVIRVQRVTYRETEKTKPIDYGTEEMPTDTLYVGEGKVLQSGIVGERTTIYLERLVDGVLESKMKVGSRVTLEPVPELLLVGTKTGLIPKGSVGLSGFEDRKAISELPAAMDIHLDVNGKPVNYKTKIVGEATAYSGGGGTSTGHSVLPGRVAVDPREIPYGTKMFIVSTDGQYIYGYAEAQDTGGFIHTSDTVVDLYMHRESDCERFGRRNVEIYILE
jgi:3D (Asp-Asp-Asp) domain-containing protein